LELAYGKKESKEETTTEIGSSQSWSPINSTWS